MLDFSLEAAARSQRIRQHELVPVVVGAYHAIERLGPCLLGLGLLVSTNALLAKRLQIEDKWLAASTGRHWRLLPNMLAIIRLLDRETVLDKPLIFCCFPKDRILVLLHVPRFE